MKRFLLLVVAPFWLVDPAAAQQASAKVVATCGAGTIPLTPGASALQINQSGQLCTTGTGGGGAGDASAANQTAVQSPVAAGAATATKSNLVAGQYLSSLPTMTNTQQGALTFDVNGRLLVLEKNSADLLTAVQSAIPAGTNLIGDVNLRQGGTALSATNGIFGNVLQGNAVLSATNGLYSNLLVGNAAVATGTGAQGATSPRVTVATDQATNAGAALKNGGVGVVNGASAWETVAASQTGQVLGATGGAGDYLSHCVVYPTTTTPGVVTVFDDTSSAANNVIAFPGGASSVSNLVPFALPVGLVSVTGAWKVTTGANLVVTCHGKFT